MRLELRVSIYILAFFFGCMAHAFNTACIVPGYGGDDSVLVGQIKPALESGGRSVEIFNTTSHLNQQGIFNPSIDQHATALYQLLSQTLVSRPGTQCLLFSHSMGGLIARRLLSNYSHINSPTGFLPIEQVVQAVVTMSSPQRGTDAFSFIGDQSQMAQLMSPQGMAAMNSPQGIYYSPWNPLVPVFAIRTYMFSPTSQANWFEVAYWNTKMNEVPSVLTDGFVPFESQVLGTELADLYIEANHTYFSLEPQSAFYYGIIFDILRMIFP